MNYERIYQQIIHRAKISNRVKSKEFYYEKHHIIPKCLNGNNLKENLVLLTAREHFICHWLLIRMYPTNNSLSYAFFAMCNKKSKRHQFYTPSSRMYQEAKESFSTIRTGYLHSTSTKVKMSNSAKKRIWSEDTKLKISNTQKGRSTSKDIKLKISNSKKGTMIGHIVSDETKERMSKSRLQYFKTKNKRG